MPPYKFPFDGQPAIKRKGRGGRRKGAGAKRKHAPTVTYSVKMTPRQAELLKLWGGGNLSAGLMWLLDQAAPLVDTALVDLSVCGK